MRYYQDVYLKRLNRYGLDYQSRIQGQREREFENYLLKTVYLVHFNYNGNLQPASLERYKQDYTETQGYLLTRINLKINNGEILDIISQDGSSNKWMIWWLEKIESSGYNKYVILKMTHQLNWEYKNQSYSQYGYFSGPGTKTISDSVKSNKDQSVYTENNNLYRFITPINQNLVKEQYLTVKSNDITEGFVVKDIDIHSTKGISYVSVDPVALREVTTDQNINNSFWANGGM